MKDKKAYAGIVVTGAVIGLIAVVLVMLGNPKNMGFCIACFLRDIAGATKLHSAPVVQYFRPEIVGLIGGALIMAMVSKEFSPKGGSAPVTRFFLGAFVMIGALVFLGCPLRMVLRIGGGDLNAIVGLAGFAVGILVGIFFLNKGFSLKRTYKLTTSEGVALPVGLGLLFVLFLLVPSLFVFSEKGPGSMHAPIIVALIAGLVVGALCQRSRMCMVAGIRDLVLFKDWKLLLGFVTIIIAALPPVVRQTGTPRAVAPLVPMGANAGGPHNVEQQTQIVKATLEQLEKIETPGKIVPLPFEYVAKI